MSKLILENDLQFRNNYRSYNPRFNTSLFNETVIGDYDLRKIKTSDMTAEETINAAYN